MPHYKLKTFCCCLCLLVCTAVCAQFSEDFSDGDYTASPVWTGTYAAFAVNPWGQLQTKAAQAGVSWLATPCTVNHKAEWIFWCRIATVPTAYNYMRFYLISDTEDPQSGNGWFVQIGGAGKNVTLCRQNEGKAETLVENVARRQVLSQEDNKLFVRVTLDENGVFELFSMVTGVDAAYVSEGRSPAGYVGGSGWCAVVVRNTAQTGGCYYLDDISVLGETVLPEETFLPEVGDVVINEIMYFPAKGGQEYVEVCNRSDVPMLLYGLGLTTRNADGELRKPDLFPPFSSVPPQGYAVLCAVPDSLALFHQCPDSALLYGCSWVRALPNTGATLLLVNTATSEVLDSIDYSPALHHPLLPTAQGVALERLHPDLPGNEPSSWHSASAEADYATPGVVNSQFQDIYADENGENDCFVWLSSDTFSPDGDGFEDVCLLHYRLPSEGFVANISVFTPNGLLVYALPANRLLATEGVLVWEGVTRSGNVAQVGVYVLMCEFANARTGRILRRRLPVVVAAR